MYQWKIRKLAQTHKANMEERIYLKKARLKGYKSIIDTEATFQPGINIIIGDNGSGKTNFLEALYESLENYAFQPEETGYANLEILNGYGSEVKPLYAWDVKIEKEILGAGDRLKMPSYLERYKVDASINYRGKEININEYFINLKDFHVQARINLFGLTKNDVDIFPVIAASFTKYGIYTPLGTSHILSSIKFVKRKGFSLPEGGVNVNIGLNTMLLLVFIKSMDKGVDEINKVFSTFYNDNLKQPLQQYTIIKDIRLSNGLFVRKENTDTIVENIQVEFLYQGRWHKWHELSDGTKRLLLIITNTLTQPNGVSFIEEPELGLYPHQLENLLDFFKEYEDRYQFIITTHSPQVLDLLTIKELDRINVVEMTKEGTKIKKLSPKQKKEAKTFYENEGLMSDYWRFDNLGLRK